MKKKLQEYHNLAEFDRVMRSTLVDEHYRSGQLPARSRTLPSHKAEA